MDVAGKTVVVTGGASGIGAALVRRFADAGARVCVFDLDPPAEQPGAVLGLACDVSQEVQVIAALERVASRIGPIDIYVSNAGILGAQKGGVHSITDATWAHCWSVNVMAHVYATRALLPDMLQRQSGYFVIVASAAGLLNQIGDAAYSATKHAAVSLAESLAISHGSDGIGVSVVCPQYVATPMIGRADDQVGEATVLLSPDDVARVTLEAVYDDVFRVLPHPEVAEYALARAGDHDRWIKGMQSLRQRALDEYGDDTPQRFYRLL